MPSKAMSPEESEKALAEVEARAKSKVPGWSHLWAHRATQLRAQMDASGDGTIAAKEEKYPAGRQIPGGGRCLKNTRQPEIQGTTRQMSGLWPWAVGGGSPLLGAPLGSHYLHGRPVYFDALDWQRAKLMTAPTQIVLGLNGYGKSSLVRAMATYAVATGRRVIFMSDCKPDYRDMTELFDGQVISAGFSGSVINLLDPGTLGEAMTKLEKKKPEAHAKLKEEIKRRTILNLTIVIELLRGGSATLQEFESSLLSAALDILTERHKDTEPPTVTDLLTLLEDEGPEDVKLCDAVSVNVGDEFLHETRAIRRSLKALVDGPMGTIFNGQTTNPINLDAPCIDIDVSAVPENNQVLRAAVMLISWQNAFAAVEAHHVLSDNGLQDKVVFDLIGDELWQLLEASPEHAVRYIDRITRTNRTSGIVLTLISHSVRDFKLVAGGASNQGRATGFIERCRAKFVGPITRQEIEDMRGIISFTETEEAMLEEWSNTPVPGEDFVPGELEKPAGMGCFILKTSESETAPGIPFRVHLPEAEKATGIHDTSKRLEK